MKKLIIPALFLTLSFSAIADIALPQIAAPVELVSGEFAEGTLTRLSDAEVAEFLPWAQNAQNQLNRAMKQAQSMPLRERLGHIERAVRSVVSRSEGRQYQMFMRYALNRGLLLVDELEKNSDMDAIGAQESALDILQRSIQIGLSFYESDLNFQRRAQDGNTATVLENARFASAFMQGMYPGIINVLDATAQYRLLYKLIEMVNWDLSRDADAPRYAETIIEAHEMLQDLPETALSNDKDNLRNVRRLNSLRIINSKAQYDEVLRQARRQEELSRLSEEERTQATRRLELERQRHEENMRLAQEFTIGAEVFYIDSKSDTYRATIVTQQENGQFVIRVKEQLYVNIPVSSLARSKGCYRDICVDVNTSIWNISSSGAIREVRVVGIYAGDKFVLYFPPSKHNSSDLEGKYGSGWQVPALVKTNGCSQGLCVGDKAIHLQRAVEVRIAGIQHDGKYLLEFLTGPSKGKLGQNWERSDLTKL